jgi:hypothetical protein
MVKEIHSIIGNVNQAIKSRAKRENRTDIDDEKQEILLNLRYHLSGLKECLGCMCEFPNPSYLLLFGDSILMHLQYMDELMEAYLYLKENNSRLRIHDLEIYRALRGHSETGEKSEAVAAINCEYGDHYPHRYRAMLPKHQEKKTLPAAVIWRLDAVAICLNADMFEDGFTPVDVQKNNKQFFTPEALRNFLLSTSKEVVGMLKERWETLSNV